MWKSRKFTPPIIEQKFEVSLARFIGAKNLSLVVTHQHFDHYNYIWPLITSLTSNFNNVLIGGLKTKSTAGELTNIPKATFCEVQKEGTLTDSTYAKKPTALTEDYLKGWLGDDSEIKLLLPESQAGNEVHDQNLVLKVTFAGRTILFPGDANGKLLDRIITTSSEALKDVDCMLLSHHGSNDSGELEWFRQAMQEVILPKASLLTIVSSDPNGTDSLPWNLVRTLKCRISEDDYCAQHGISVRGKTILSVSPRKKYEISKIPNVTQPIFTTCDSSKEYYKITITADGTIILQDGEEIPQFCSFKSSLEPLDLAKAISEEIIKFIPKAQKTEYCKWLTEKLKSLHIALKDFAKTCLFPMFSFDWADFLWDNDLLKTDGNPTKSLANLLIAYTNNPKLFEGFTEVTPKNILETLKLLEEQPAPPAPKASPEDSSKTTNRTEFLQWVKQKAAEKVF